MAVLTPLQGALFGGLVLACSLAPQAAEAKPRQYGTLFKGEIDGLVRTLRSSAPESGGFGDGSCLDTAKVLAAMGHCHRFYTLGDGPVVRPAVQRLFAARGADGAFGDGDTAARRETTGWVVSALRVMDPVAFADDVRSAERWLAEHGGAEVGFAAAVRRVLADERGLEAIGAEIAEQLAAGRLADPVAAFVDLVACQHAGRALDAGRDPLDLDGDEPEWSDVRQKGFDFLLKQQEDGVFMVATGAGRFPDAGLTGLGVAALQTKPEELRTEAEQAVIDKGLAWLLEQQNDDGSFGQRNANYSTCAAVLGIAKAKREEFRPALEKAQRYILAIQNVEERGYAPSDRDYGSIGYGGDQRGDLSNLQFAVQALRESGLDEQHEAFAKAIVFLQRTQNLKAVNDFEGRVRDDDEWRTVTSGDDGGAVYYPGNSPAGYIELPDGKTIPRSYGSMTYALLKTYTLAGVEADDPRVQAAVEWLERNWELDENPGADPRLPEKYRYQGLYYYYMVMAQALDTAGIDTLHVPAEDGDAVLEVDWRKLLTEHLGRIQHADGSWVNDENDRWWESQAALCTLYALLALERAAE